MKELDKEQLFGDLGQPVKIMVINLLHLVLKRGIA